MTSVRIPATVEQIDPAFFQLLPNATAIAVAEGNPVYTSYNGMLFGTNDAGDPTNLLLVPEGKEGNAVLPATMASVPACAFSRCTKLSAIIATSDAGGSASSAFSSQDGILYTSDMTTLVAAPAGLGASARIADGCQTIAEGAFWGNAALATIVAPASVKAIAVNEAYDAQAIAEAIANAADAADAADEAAADTTAADADAPATPADLDTTVPAFDPAVVESATVATSDDAVWKLAGFTSFAEPARPGDTSAPEADQAGYVFTLLSDYTVSVSWQGGLPEQIDIPAVGTVGGASYAVSAIAEGAFAGQTGLTSVTVPDTVRTIGARAFQGCTALTTVTLGTSVTVISSSAFAGTALDTIVLPASVRTISAAAFGQLQGATIVALAAPTDVAADALEGSTGVRVFAPTAEGWPASLPAAGNHVLPYGVTLAAASATLDIDERTPLYAEGGLQVPEGVDTAFSYRAKCVSVAGSDVVGKQQGSSTISVYLKLGDITLASASMVVEVLPPAAPPAPADDQEEAVEDAAAESTASANIPQLSAVLSLEPAEEVVPFNNRMPEEGELVTIRFNAAGKTADPEAMKVICSSDATVEMPYLEPITDEDDNILVMFVGWTAADPSEIDTLALLDGAYDGPAVWYQFDEVPVSDILNAVSIPTSAILNAVWYVVDEESYAAYEKASHDKPTPMSGGAIGGDPVKWTVTFNNSATNARISSATVNSGTTFAAAKAAAGITSDPSVPTATGYTYTFIGWVVSTSRPASYDNYTGTVVRDTSTITANTTYWSVYTCTVKSGTLSYTMSNCTRSSGTTSGTTATYGTTYTITFTANTGYTLEGVTPSYTASNYGTTPTWTVASGGGSATWTCSTITGAVTFSVVAKARTGTLSYTMSNCTRSSGTTSGTTASYGTTYTITFTANTGYTLTGVTPAYTASNYGTTPTWTVASGGGSATWTCSTITGAVTFSVVAKARTGTLSYTMSNCTRNSGATSGTTATYGTASSVVFKANTGYTLTGVSPSYTASSYTTTPSWTVSADGTTATWTCSSIYGAVTFSVTAKARTGTLSYTMSNCTKTTNSTASGTTATYGTTYTVTFTANAGYMFTGVTPSYTASNYATTPSWTVSADGTSATWSCSTITGAVTFSVAATFKTSKVTYTIDSTLCSASPASGGTATYGTTYTVTFTAKDGYTFDGAALPTVSVGTWSGSGTTRTWSSNAVQSDIDLGTVTPVKRIYEYALDPNPTAGGAGVTPAKVYLWYSKGWYAAADATGTAYTATTFPQATPATGYTFAGWQKDASTTVAAGTLPSLTWTAVGTLTAQYTGVQITLQLNAADADDAAVRQQHTIATFAQPLTTKASSGGSLTSTELTVPARKGYTLEGFYMVKDGTSMAVQEHASTNANLPGAAASTGAPAGAVKVFGVSADGTALTDAYGKNWDQAAAGDWACVNDSTIVLYPLWVRTQVSIIALDPNCEASSIVTPGTQTVYQWAGVGYFMNSPAVSTFDQTADALANGGVANQIARPDRGGNFVLDGFYSVQGTDDASTWPADKLVTSAESNWVLPTADGAYMYFTGDATLYAKWSEVSSVIRFYVDGAEVHSFAGVPGSAVTVGFPDVATYDKTGYWVDGWYTDAACTVAATGTPGVAGAFPTPAAGADSAELIYYAKFVPYKIAVTYDAGEGAYDGTLGPVTLTFDQGASADQEGNADDLALLGSDGFTKAGYIPAEQFWAAPVRAAAGEGDDGADADSEAPAPTTFAAAQVLDHDTYVALLDAATAGARKADYTLTLTAQWRLHIIVSMPTELSYLINTSKLDDPDYTIDVQAGRMTSSTAADIYIAQVTGHPLAEVEEAETGLPLQEWAQLFTGISSRADFEAAMKVPDAVTFTISAPEVHADDALFSVDLSESAALPSKDVFRLAGVTDPRDKSSIVLNYEMTLSDAVKAALAESSGGWKRFATLSFTVCPVES